MPLQSTSVQYLIAKVSEDPSVLKALMSWYTFSQRRPAMRQTLAASHDGLLLASVQVITRSTVFAQRRN